MHAAAGLLVVIGSTAASTGLLGALNAPHPASAAPPPAPAAPPTAPIASPPASIAPPPAPAASPSTPAAPPSAPAAPIVGRVFRSVTVERDGHPLPLFDGVPVWLSFDHGSFRARADCNRLWGPLRVTASQLRLSSIGQTAMGCMPAEREQRDELLAAFLSRDPQWRIDGDRLVLTQGSTTITLERDDLPPPLPRPNPARPRDLIAASLHARHLQTWPQGIGDTWGGPVVKVAITARGGRRFLTMQARCRRLEAPLTIRRSTLTVGAPRTRRARCRNIGTDDLLDSVRPFFGGTVMWHLDRRRLTLQRDRATLTLRAR